MLVHVSRSVLGSIPGVSTLFLIESDMTSVTGHYNTTSDAHHSLWSVMENLPIDIIHVARHACRKSRNVTVHAFCLLKKICLGT